MDFGHCCFFYIAAASATLPFFYLRSPLVHNTSCALLALCRSLPMCFCAAFALSAPCLSASCFPFFIGFSLFGRFLRGSLPSTSFTLNSPRTFRYPASPAAPDLTPLTPYPCPAIFMSLRSF